MGNKSMARKADVPDWDSAEVGRIFVREESVKKRFRKPEKIVFYDVKLNSSGDGFKCLDPELAQIMSMVAVQHENRHELENRLNEVCLQLSVLVKNVGDLNELRMQHVPKVARKKVSRKRR